MQQSAPRSSLSWLLLAGSLLVVTGCRTPAAPPEPLALAESAVPVVEVAQVEPTLAEADAAVQEGRYAHAAEFLDALQANATLLSAEQAVLVEALRERISEAPREQDLPASPQTGVPAPLELSAEGGPQVAANMLAEAEQLWNGRRYGEAAARVDALDALRGQLPVSDRLLYDELRRQVQAVTQQVRALSDEERTGRAREHLEAGLRARDAGDYAAAGAHLRMAALFDADLDRGADRELRGARAEVEEAIRQARGEIAEASRWLAAGRPDDARDTLERLRRRGLRMGPLSEEADLLVARANEAIAERARLEVEEQAAQAAVFLAQAAAAADQGEFERAAGLLGDLKPLTHYLDEADRSRYDALCDALEEATGVRPGLSADEVRALAERELDAGLAAYEAGRYADARPRLDRVARLGVDLGWRKSRQLRQARERVDETLARLLGLYRTGRRQFEAKDYAGARRALEEVRDSGTQIGGAEQEDVARLLAEIDRKEREEREARRAEAARLFDEARKLAAGGDYAAAIAALTALGTRSEWLTPAQRQERESLLASATKAEARARAERQMQETERLAAEAAKLLAIRSAVQASLTACDDAIAGKDYGAAEARLADAAAALAGADPAQGDVLGSLAKQVELKREVVNAARLRQARVAAVVRRLDGLADEAKHLSQTDLLAAEAKVNEMLKLARAENVPLSTEQDDVREAIVGVVQKVYRVDRWLRPKEYERLVPLASQYMEAGEPAKARWALELVTNAPPDMVTEDCRALALGKLTAARHAVDLQAAAAARLLDACGACRGKLAAADAAGAIDGAAGVLRAAEEERLAGEPLWGVLDAVVAFLGTDVPAAMKEAPSELRRHVSETLPRARVELAESLAPIYLQAGRPELAEPYLAVLTTARGVKVPLAEWARTQTKALPRLRAEAEEARDRGIPEETGKMHKRAARLLELAQSGDVAAAEATRVELTDMRVAMEVRKARNAFERGAYDEALALIEAAPVDGASERMLTDVYQPAAAEVRRARDVDAALRGAEAALDACDVVRAAELLGGMSNPETLPEPDRLRREALASVVDSAGQLLQRHLAVAARAEQDLARARTAMALARQREGAWTAYQEKLTDFLTGRQKGSGPLRALVVQSAGLRDFEVAEVDAILDVLVAEEREQAAAEAKALLAQAADAYNVGDYLTAANTLAALKRHAGFALAEGVEANAAEVEAAVREKEQEAEALYQKAAEAYRAGDKVRAGELAAQLRTLYGKTAAYRDHQ